MAKGDPMQRDMVQSPGMGIGPSQNFAIPNANNQQGGVNQFTWGTGAPPNPQMQMQSGAYNPQTAMDPSQNAFQRFGQGIAANNFPQMMGLGSGVQANNTEQKNRWGTK